MGNLCFSQEKRADRTELRALLRYRWDEKRILRGHQNILNGLFDSRRGVQSELWIFRTRLGSGTPRELRNRRFWFVFCASLAAGSLFRAADRPNSSFSSSRLNRRQNHPLSPIQFSSLKKAWFRHGLLSTSGLFLLLEFPGHSLFFLRPNIRGTVPIHSLLLRPHLNLHLQLRKRARIEVRKDGLPLTFLVTIRR